MTGRRWPRRLAIALGIFLSIVVLFALFEHGRGKRMLTRRLDELKSKGEEMRVAVLKPRPLPAEQNAFAILAILTNRTDSLLTNASLGPPSMKIVEPGRAVVSWKQSQWDSDQDATNDWTWLSSELDAAGELIRQLHAAAAQPGYDCGFNYHNGFLDFQMGPIITSKRGIEVLNLAMLHDLRKAEPADALTNLCALVKLALMQEPEPLVICQLVRYSCVILAFNATWQALQFPDWTVEQLAAIHAAWKPSEFVRDLQHAMEMERAMTLEYFDQLRTSKANGDLALQRKAEVNELVGTEFDPLPTTGFLLHWVHAPFWRFTWAYQDQLRSLNRWQVLIDRARFAQINSWSALANGTGPSEHAYSTVVLGDPENAGWYNRVRYLFSSDTFSISDVVIRRALALETMQQMVLAAIAIERHGKVSGTLPPDLRTLVPRYLSAVPMDRMDGKPLRYQKESENTFLLYSVGTDGKDDGGDPSPSAKDHLFRQIWDGNDAVWPRRF
jgi:hypothetical protein